MSSSESGHVNWDEDLPEKLRLRWEQWVSSLIHFQKLKIPRKYSDISFVKASRREIHVFSDASKDAIASVAYLKLFFDEHSDVSFLMGKAKVSPTNGHTIPRLEMCAAVLSVEIADIVKQKLNIDSKDVHYYTDSKVVLGYVTNETRRFFMYVSNRVNRIRASSSPEKWSYVATDHNPADIATRHLSSTDLPDSVYLSGPSFLLQNVYDIEQEYILVNPSTDKEVHPRVATITTDIHKDIKLSNRFSHFSSWNSLVRAITLLKRVVLKLHDTSHPSRTEVKCFIIKTVQREVFSTELHSVTTGMRYNRVFYLYHLFWINITFQSVDELSMHMLSQSIYNLLSFQRSTT
jgi:hypothetical protein